MYVSLTKLLKKKKTLIKFADDANFGEIVRAIDDEIKLQKGFQHI